MPAFERLILSGAASMGSDTLHRNRNTLTWICPIFVDLLYCFAILWIYYDLFPFLWIYRSIYPRSGFRAIWPESPICLTMFDWKTMEKLYIYVPLSQFGESKTNRTR